MNQIWKNAFSLDDLNKMSKNTMGEHLDIEFIEKGNDYLIASMPVDRRTHQPYGILHGGASAVLAETLGSIASAMCISDLKKFAPVGIEINASHLRSVAKGKVFGKVSPERVGRSVHVWRIEITDERDKFVCVSRLTVSIIPKS